MQVITERVGVVVDDNGVGARVRLNNAMNFR
jgi:hypothetical protein